MYISCSKSYSIVMCIGGTTAAPNAANHNHTPAGNFKRQNTVDSATIKENTARINSASAAVRPATVKNTPLPGIEPCTSPFDTCKNLKCDFFFLIFSRFIYFTFIMSFLACSDVSGIVLSRLSPLISFLMFPHKNESLCCVSH